LQHEWKPEKGEVCRFTLKRDCNSTVKSL